MEVTILSEYFKHHILLQRLSELGLAGTKILWFTSYLSNCVQWAKYNGSYYFWGSVQGGIPQGSALGPLLIYFSAYEQHVLADCSW